MKIADLVEKRSKQDELENARLAHTEVFFANDMKTSDTLKALEMKIRRMEEELDIPVDERTFMPDLSTEQKLRLESLRARINYIHNSPARAYCTYTEAEDIYVDLALQQGQSWEEIANVLQRSPSAVKRKILAEYGVFS